MEIASKRAVVVNVFIDNNYNSADIHTFERIHITYWVLSISPSASSKLFWAILRYFSIL